MNASILSNIDSVLNRNEMKNILGGSEPVDEIGETNCVICISESHGVESWEVEFDGQDPTDVCNNDIWYPEGQTITGIWGSC